MKTREEMVTWQRFDGHGMETIWGGGLIQIPTDTAICPGGPMLPHHTFLETEPPHLFTHLFRHA